MPPLITLTTDFGTRDSYVAEVKGVLYSEGPPGLRLSDLSHEIGAHKVEEAALFLRAAVRRFPAGTIHLVVVDPGVGSTRRPLAACAGGQILVGPDNGVFAYLFDGTEEVFVIEPGRLARKSISATFHGRDIFAPAAALLAKGKKLGDLGSKIADAVHLPFPLVQLENNALHGQVLHVDRFGNLITNVTEETLRRFLEGTSAAKVSFKVGTTLITGLREHYSQVAAGELVALIGSAGLLELSAREQSAAVRTGAQRSSAVLVVREGVA